MAAITSTFIRQRTSYWVLGSIMALAFILRTFGLQNSWLWYDELQSVTFSILPIDQLLASVRRFDPHPPFYYLQLHFWMVFGANDVWVKLNSVVWSIATIIIIFLAGRKLFDLKTALLASLLFALSPFALFHAQEARMYSMLMCLGIGVFYFIYRFLEDGAWWTILVALCLMICFLYSHGTGFMLLVSVGAYAAWDIAEGGRPQLKRVLPTSILLVLATVMYIPWLRIAASISVGHTMTPSLMDVVNTLFKLLGGFAKQPDWLVLAVIFLFTIGMVSSLFANKRERLLVVAFVLAPIACCIAISYLYRPIWLYRTLAYLTPFWMILIARSSLRTCKEIKTFGHKGKSSRRILLCGWPAIAIVFFVYTQLLQQLSFEHPWHFKNAAEFVKSATQAGDVVYVPNERVLWGIGWYLIGPGSINPLQSPHAIVGPDQIILVSTLNADRKAEQGGNWVIFRSPGDDISPFTTEDTSNSQWDFGGLRVAKIVR